MPCSVLRTWISEEELAVGGEHQSGLTTPKKRQEVVLCFAQLTDDPEQLIQHGLVSWGKR